MKYSINMILTLDCSSSKQYPEQSLKTFVHHACDARVLAAMNDRLPSGLRCTQVTIVTVVPEASPISE